MQNQSILCPGKVFLLGEYLVLTGGPGLTVATLPKFELRILGENGSSLADIFHPLSPAGTLLQKHISHSRNASSRAQWIDPYDTPIGVGSSSAQFLCSAAALDLKAVGDLKSLLSLYWETIGISQGIRPSGADIASQWQGGVNLFENRTVTQSKVLTLNQETLAEIFHRRFFLVFTGSKAKTHEHLTKLKATGFPNETTHQQIFVKMTSLVLKGTELFQRQNWNALGKLLTEYQILMTELTYPVLTEEECKVSAWTQIIQRLPQVLGAKVSGAQGGDCILVLADRDALSTQTEIESFKSRLLDSAPLKGGRVFELVPAADGLSRDAL